MSKLEQLREKKAAMLLGGGEKRIQAQHDRGKKTARERLDLLFDEGTFVELETFVAHRCTNFDMAEKELASEGVVVGYGMVDGRLVFAFSQDFTVAGGSNPPVNNVDLNMFADFMYMPNPLQQNATAYFSASVINMGNTAFTGSLRLVLETNNDEHVQTIQQIPVTAPVAPNASSAYNFSATITAAPGFYKLVLYYKPDGASNWLAVGSNYNASYQNPKPVIVNAPDGIEDLALETATLRPNPATDHFYLDVPDQTIDRLEIYSSTGQLVHSQGNLTSSESIGISFLRSGVYFVRYESSGRVGVQKLIVR